MLGGRESGSGRVPRGGAGDSRSAFRSYAMFILYPQHLLEPYPDTRNPSPPGDLSLSRSLSFLLSLRSFSGKNKNTDRWPPTHTHAAAVVVRAVPR